MCVCLLVLVWPGIGSNQDMLILAFWCWKGVAYTGSCTSTGVHCHTVQSSPSPSYIIATIMIKYNAMVVLSLTHYITGRTAVTRIDSSTKFDKVVNEICLAGCCGGFKTHLSFDFI